MENIGDNGNGQENGEMNGGKRKLPQEDRQAGGEEEQAGPSGFPCPSKHACDVRFSDAEKEQLYRSVCENYKVLFRSKASASTKKQIWARITKEVSLLGGKTRDAKQIQHRWCDTRREVKEKAGKIEVSLHRTVGGPACILTLTPLEELIMSTLHTEVVDEVPAPDDCDRARRSSSIKQHGYPACGRWCGRRSRISSCAGIRIPCCI
ncbi:t-SNARE domain-containing protein 1-like [Rhinatrema bivittatum]|uniref:t-SNARE domain-containing protein 1-like n=1 Tax=Rhinatrema bivittatum TaxID=194408 RepID=UPI001126708A|nr:t-SNARE domain-containing protein 1-like [Rhinatrema bivittatum]